MHYWKLYIDGASRNNPGLAGAGVYILKDEICAFKEGFFLGIKTNNQAEYLALLLGLFYIQYHAKSTDLVQIFSDSQLLVRQLQGIYKVKNTPLIPLHAAAKALLAPMRYDITHIMREDNTQADKLANEGIDTKKPVPPEFITMLEAYEIPW